MFACARGEIPRASAAVSITFLSIKPFADFGGWLRPKTRATERSERFPTTALPRLSPPNTGLGTIRRPSSPVRRRWGKRLSGDHQGSGRGSIQFERPAVYRTWQRSVARGQLGSGHGIAASGSAWRANGLCFLVRRRGDFSHDYRRVFAGHHHGNVQDAISVDHLGSPANGGVAGPSPPGPSDPY
jgi:hypothetical protein